MMGWLSHVSSINYLAVRRTYLIVLKYSKVFKDHLRAIFLFVPIVALLSSCGPVDAYRTYAGAVGPDLYSSKTVNNSVLLDTYVSNICHQAGLIKSGQCVIGSTSDWKTFVDMGLYDIDQRCDTFLDRLYYKEKTYDPILTQISDTRTFTGALLDATKSSRMAISIVASAFSLAESSFRNTRGSLLEALDPTTVKSIVFRRQQQIKTEIYRTLISSKPQALHALRTYLRVCMPFTIEMEANALLTTLQRTGDIGQSPIAFDAAAYQQTLRSTPQSKGDQSSIPDGSVVNSSGDIGSYEQTMSPDSHRRFAKAICDNTLGATANDFGPQDSPLRKTIELWETGLAKTDATKVKPDGVIDTAFENEAVLQLISRQNAYRCDARPTLVKSAYEVALLGSVRNRISWQTRIADYLDEIRDLEFGKTCGAEDAVKAFKTELAINQSGAFGPASRKALAAAKSCLLKSSEPPAIKEDDLLEPALWQRL